MSHLLETLFRCPGPPSALPTRPALLAACSPGRPAPAVSGLKLALHSRPSPAAHVSVPAQLRRREPVRGSAADSPRAPRAAHPAVRRPRSSVPTRDRDRDPRASLSSGVRAGQQTRARTDKPSGSPPSAQSQPPPPTPASPAGTQRLLHPPPRDSEPPKVPTSLGSPGRGPWGDPTASGRRPGTEPRRPGRGGSRQPAAGAPTRADKVVRAGAAAAPAPDRPSDPFTDSRVPGGGSPGLAGPAAAAAAAAPKAAPSHAGPSGRRLPRLVETAAEALTCGRETARGGSLPPRRHVSPASGAGEDARRGRTGTAREGGRGASGGGLYPGGRHWAEAWEGRGGRGEGEGPPGGGPAAPGPAPTPEAERWRAPRPLGPRAGAVGGGGRAAW